MIQLSEMMGTTRPRISLFMQRFHNLGLIETNKDLLFHHQRKKTHRVPRSDHLERAELFKTTKAGDSGLGLPVVQQIVSAHNGATFTAISQQQPS